MKDKILTWCRDEGLLPPGSRVVCAVSGGLDSVALLHLLSALREPLGLTLTAAHYNHCLRGAESDEDEAFVRRLCHSWGIPLTVGRGDVASHAKQTGRSIEEAARDLRYGFLLSQEGLIATAHNADDQVETVLLNLIRGTGLRGLTGIAPRTGALIRPLLPVTRAEIESYCAAHDLPHREDSSNSSDDYARNRLRHQVVPLLRQENPSLSEAVGRMTALLRQDENRLEAETQDLLQKAARPGGWDCPALLEAPAVLRRRAIRALLPCPKPSMAHVEAVERLITEKNGTKAIDLTGGWTARRCYRILHFEQKASPGGKAFPPASLFPGQTVSIPPAGLRVSLSGPVILEKKVDSLSTFAVKCDRMESIGPILIRPRQTGDVLTLPGGSRTVKRLMIDRKIPAAQRNLTPVLADRQGIFAVYGVGADPARTARPGDRALLIQILRKESDNNDQQI